MKKYKMIKHPQSNEGVKIEYAVNNNLILKSELFRYVEEEFQIEKTFYFDLSSLDVNSHYLGEYPVSSVITTETEINIDVINTVGDEWTEDEANPKWFDATFEDFDIPEDAEIIELEELVFPETDSSPLESLMKENEELKKRISSLQTQTDFNKQNSEVMMMELIGMISSLV